MAQKYPMTDMGKKKLEEELSYLKGEKQREINDEIKYLRSFCDFSDNTSFNEMLKEQALVKERIIKIEDMLYNAEIIDPSVVQTSRVMLGTQVTIVEIPHGEEETYTIVGTSDADPIENKVSTESPIGKSLLGSKINDEVYIETPSGKIGVKILDIRS